jgi:hypothetical protein
LRYGIMTAMTSQDDRKFSVTVSWDQCHMCGPSVMETSVVHDYIFISFYHTLSILPLMNTLGF